MAAESNVKDMRSIYFLGAVVYNKFKEDILENN